MKANRENYFISTLVEAMLGAITPNIRAVALEVANEQVFLHVVLEHDSAVDREEIDDIVMKFEALQPNRIELEVDIRADAQSFDKIQIPGRLVYLRREP